MTGPREKSDRKVTAGATAVVVSIIPELLPLATVYLARKRKEISGIRQVAVKADYERLRRMGHDLKGSGGAYGLPQLSALGSRIESAAIACDPEMLQTIIDDLEKFLQSVRLE